MERPVPTSRIRGFEIFQSYLNPLEQAQVVDDLRNIVAQAPLFSPLTPGGRRMSVKMSSAGQFGWFSDASGYRYVPKHPSGRPWPEIPQSILKIWQVLAPDAPDPECCLINFYQSTAKMGMHQDRDEACFDWPVVSISLGDDGLFRIGNETKGGKTESIWLSSGDVVVMGGAARLTYHGIDKIRPVETTVLKNPGRINLTMRVVTR